MMERGLPVGDSLFLLDIFFESIVHCTLYENLHEKICMQTKFAGKIKIYIQTQICMKMRIRK